MTFAEQVDGLTERYQRRTPLLRRLLTAIGIVAPGLPGARLAALLPCAIRNCPGDHCQRWERIQAMFRFQRDPCEEPRAFTPGRNRILK
ncbi:hypothetical protein ACFV7R_44750 [Streptomyces sp. NPDC059866]|uniref:hypothetical protein n=1 Tax=Streptomyces sp. NPDC059866 TaxID=3346978 RepID=UPI003655915B